jgi:hypothetical protein
MLIFEKRAIYPAKGKAKDSSGKIKNCKMIASRRLEIEPLRRIQMRCPVLLPVRALGEFVGFPHPTPNIGKQRRPITSTLRNRCMKVVA